MEVQVFLLGNPRVLLDHTEVIFPYRKVEGLFYYLCIKGVVSRDEAIGILWADCTEGSARKNLRDALYHLKKLFGEELISAEGNNRITLKKECIASPATFWAISTLRIVSSLKIGPPASERTCCGNIARPPTAG